MINDNISNYLVEISKYHLYTYDEEKEAFLKFKNGGKDIREELIKRNLKLVVFIAKKYNNYLPMSELISYGNEGLINAVDKFDPNAGYSFSTYASTAILRAIQKNVYKQKELFNIPINISILANKYDRYINDYFLLNHKYPNDKEIINKLQISEEELKNIKLINLNIISFDEPVKEESESTYSEFIEDKSNFEDKIFNKYLNQDIKDLLNEVIQNEKEKNIFFDLIGINTNMPQTVESVSKKYNMNKSNILLIQSKILKNLRHNNKIKQKLLEYYKD